MARSKDEFAVRLSRRRSAFGVDRSVLSGKADRPAELNSDALLVYLALLARADTHDGTCFPGTRTIAEDTRLSRPTVLKAIDRLAACGWIEVQKGDNGTRQTYFVDPSPVDGSGEPVNGVDRSISLPVNVVDRFPNGSGQSGDPDRSTTLTGPVNHVDHNKHTNNEHDVPSSAPALVKEDDGANRKAPRRLPAEYTKLSGATYPAAPPPKAAEVAWWMKCDRDRMFSLLVDHYPHEHDRNRAQLVTARQWWRDNDPDTEQARALFMCITRAKADRHFMREGGAFVPGFGNFLARADYRRFADDQARALLKGL